MILEIRKSYNKYPNIPKYSTTVQVCSKDECNDFNDYLDEFQTSSLVNFEELSNVQHDFIGADQIKESTIQILSAKPGGLLILKINILH